MTAGAGAPTIDVSTLKPVNNSKQEVAEFIGNSVDYINALMRDGKLGYYKRGSARQSNVSIGRNHVAALSRSWER